GVIQNTPGIHGIVIVPKAGHGFTSNGKTNTVSVFDLKTLKTTSEVHTGNKPDAMLLDNFSGRVFVFNNEGGSTTVIDAASGKFIDSLALGGAPEAGVSDEKGTIFVNL